MTATYATCFDDLAALTSEIDACGAEWHAQYARSVIEGGSVTALRSKLQDLDAKVQKIAFIASYLHSSKKQRRAVRRRRALRDALLLAQLVVLCLREGSR